MAHGVNYYDTAYIYHGGRSETVLGRVLSGYPRDSYYVADKFNIQANPDYRFQFQDQLARLQMDYIDFYLLHGITDLTAADYENCGCISYFQEKKRKGKIRYFGFSFHGTPGCLRKLLEKNDWDFVQIKLNYYDWYQGTARQQYEILREHDIPFLLSAYNDYRDEAAALGDKNLAVWRLFRLKALAKEKQPSACIGCGSCTAHCPQGLDIPSYMREMSAV